MSHYQQLRPQEDRNLFGRNRTIKSPMSRVLCTLTRCSDIFSPRADISFKRETAQFENFIGMDLPDMLSL